MLDKIRIKNFKSIKEIVIDCNDRFNVIIGQNNIGKTSVFEAIHLWKICYDACIQKSDKKSFYATSKNILFSDNEYLRVFEDKDLVNNDLYKDCKDIEIELIIKYNGNTCALGFQITKVLTLDNAYLQTSYINRDEFNRFSNIVKLSEFNLTNILIICESRPIANIVAKEPYMYKSQVIDKISRGKGYEVLRNKIVKSTQVKELIEMHITNVLGSSYSFSEIDKDNKTYIRLLVNGTNILSQGSGFLQIAEIFSSLEYTQAGIYILLIDEPDSHLHMSLQKELIKELRSIDNSQTFVITHNDKFISYIPEQEILFINAAKKESGIISPIEQGYKYLILENLIGDVDKVDRLRVANKIVLCEGQTDVAFFNQLLEKYKEINDVQLPSIFIEKLDGIDALNDKLVSYSRAYNEIVQEDAEWIVIRDSDCLPISKQKKSSKKSKTYITATNKQIVFQAGYGIESTFIHEVDKLTDLILAYYELDNAKYEIVKAIIQELKNEYATKVRDCLDTVHIELERHFNRQFKVRDEYKHLSLHDMLAEINSDNIEYIMTKPILNMFLSSLHDRIIANYEVQTDKLDNDTIIAFYLSRVSTENIYDCHQDILNTLIN
ncbi:ATP-dependent nuclease [Pygmaiobacter massiliensis]|uniref:ATP-dependent nuclease n=1 Tax=Pygmaiobacter massiliensis TaxID=1917873 RepID=UPI000C7C31A2|nr:AAA family ATPase [Pygmaiobacter massiliensis]